MAGAQTAWGLDVGVTSLKAIKLRRDGDQVYVEAYEVVEHSKFLSEPDVDKDEIIRATLQKFVAHYPLRREQVFIGVPGSSAFARFVKLPPVEPKKVPEIVKFEAIQQIPFPLDQVNWDYHTFQSPDSPDIEVGIFAMKKELVAQVLSNFEQQDMTVHGVQISPLAVYNAVAYDGLTDEKGTVVIDMGAEHTDLVVMDQGRLWLRAINIGGNHFTDALAKSFKQPFDRAEQLKKTAATSKYQKQIFQAMRPIFADLVAEIQRSIGHYNSSHRDSKLERILGMGNPFKLPNLQKYLQQELKMEVVRLDGFRRTKIDPKLAAGFQEAALGMATAYGLAVQGLGYAPIKTSLLPPEIARAMDWKRKTPWFIASTAAVLAAVGLVGFEYYSAGAAYASTQNQQAQANSSEIAQAMQLKQQWSAKVNSGQFETDKTQLEQSLTLARARQIWPALSLDIYQSVPQNPNKPAATQPASTQPTTQTASAATQPGAATQPSAPHVVVITNINSQYSGTLSLISTSGNAVNVPMPQQPQPQDMGDTPDDIDNIDNIDQIDTPAAPPPPSPTLTAAQQALEGPSDHGFIVTIQGYTQYVPGLEPYDIAHEYIQALNRRAPLNRAKDANTLYYFTDFALSGLPVPDAPPPGVDNSMGNMMGQNTGPWAKNKGPFWELFAMDLSAAKAPPKPLFNPLNPAESQQPQQNPVLQGDLGGPIDAYERNPKQGIKYMYNDYQFTIQFKVHVK